MYSAFTLIRWQLRDLDIESVFHSTKMNVCLNAVYSVFTLITAICIVSGPKPANMRIGTSFSQGRLIVADARLNVRMSKGDAGLA